MSRRILIAHALAACGATFALTGCAGIDVLHESANCGAGTARQAVLVRDQNELDKLWQGFRAEPTATSSAPAADFRYRQVLYLAESEKPTAGYGLRLASPNLKVNQGVAGLQLETTTPGGMTAQVITRPCLLLSLPGGDYQRVEAFDQSGRLWGVAERGN
jgi:hypothetical protein